MKTLLALQKISLFLLVSLNCVSCATVINGTTQKIPLTSEPMGASVMIDGQPVGYTPTQVEVKRKYSHLITFEKDGYESENVKLEPVLSGAVAGNILAGGFIGWGVDAINGSQYRLIPDAVNVRLKPCNFYNHCQPSFNPPYYYQ
ncbi:MAG: PEGA domain-containing protein [Candidatus Protochlamydia sp.]|nr:PEGA domain-containing protein [Candidatus Protochlamydia sp.]